VIASLLEKWAERAPDSTAIVAPGGVSLSYRNVLRQVESLVGDLNRAGVGRGDRVAIVLPNGPQMALTFLAAASGAVAAPLNPAYRTGEFEFHLGDLRPKVLIVARGADSPSRAVATALGVAVLELTPPEGEPGGLFGLSGGPYQPTADGGFAEGSGAALLLHTSGTTSRPKLVMLTRANLCVAADNIRESLALGADDRCLNVMPLFHVHGLIGALLSSLAAGGSVVCSPGFDALQFFGWLDEFQPSWYTAVPAMHQALLPQASLHADVIARRPLRFIRSCSAALAPRLMQEIEMAFCAPLIEAYGMTEAAHQMTSNPLPPGIRKRGSVGRATGLQVAVVDDAGSPLTAWAVGEVAVCGESVTPGYEGNPQANASSFSEGWFRTGDLGYLDTEGYLFLTGRIKEIINRGGEKISPREIEEVLCDHPAVSEALTFAAPHKSLGQDVVAAVVLRARQSLTEGELRGFSAARLSSFKVPQRIYFLDELPHGATGKPQRAVMAERLGLLPGGKGPEKFVAPEFVAPRTAVERRVAAIWCELLNVERVGVNDGFAQLGGDSLLAAQLVARIGQALHVDAEAMDLLGQPTVAAMAAEIEREMDLRVSKEKN
jgi:acyl-CoA synthetase (AMP-forming)/AMP-acid ligase II